MALIDKNIVITPNVGSASDPQIVFSGASSTLGPQNITMRVYPTSNGTLSWEGSAGQLFSITNSLSGTIFSVNDVSGIPSIEVLDTGLVKLAQYNGRVLVRTGTDNGSSSVQIGGNITSTSSTTGTMIVTGGVGISENLFVGGSFTTGSINNTPIGNTGPSTGAFTTLAANNVVSFTLNQASSSTTTGTLRVTGGVGISGNIYTGGSVFLTANTTSIRQTSTANWSGDSGAATGKLEYHSNRWYINAGTDSTEVVKFRRGATDVATIDNSGNLTISGDLTVSGGQITTDAVSTRDKLRVWNDSTYTIGMQTGFTFGPLNNDYAMTFQMSNTDARGFWWGDSSHAQSGGAMSLSTNGKLTVAHSVRLGYGETDTTIPGATYRLDVSGNAYISGKVRTGDVFWENGKIISTSRTIDSTVNTMSIGPITINDGVSVTIPDNGTWTVV
jgi:hypothetical protein